jgi:hypothetical protein
MQAPKTAEARKESPSLLPSNGRQVPYEQPESGLTVDLRQYTVRPKGPSQDGPRHKVQRHLFLVGSTLPQPVLSPDGLRNRIQRKEQHTDRRGGLRPSLKPDGV